MYHPASSRNDPPSSYAFIDGASLDTVLNKVGQRYFQGNKPKVNWNNIRGSNKKVFYYDAIPVQNIGEDENSYINRISPKTTELAYIERQNSYHVRTGDVRNRRKRGNEQKMVDVQLAVDALSMASKGLFSAVSLVTGDLDFKPLVSALVEMGIEVNVIYPIGETSDTLLAAADIATPLDISLIHSWLDTTDPGFDEFPRVTWTNDLPYNAEPSRIVTWDSGGQYKHCSIYKTGPHYELFTDVNAPMLIARRFVISAKSIDNLRSYSQEVYDITIPQF